MACFRMVTNCAHIFYQNNAGGWYVAYLIFSQSQSTMDLVFIQLLNKTPSFSISKRTAPFNHNPGIS